MKRTAKNLITALCCTGMLAAVGCSSAGELSVSGMYGSQGQALSGDQCEDLLLDAAGAQSEADLDAARAAYHQCVEDALDENGQHAECRDRDDNTCDVILQEIGDTMDRVRNSQGQDAPDCAAPATNAEDAVCHLMAAYEACSLDRDNDGDPDVCRPDEPNCQPQPPRCDETNGQCEPEPPRCDNADGQCEPEPPRCDNADGQDCGPTPTGCDDSNDPDCAPEPPQCEDGNADCAPPPQCEDGSQDCAPQPGDPTDPNGSTTDPSEPNGTNADAFCQALADDLANCGENECADQRELYQRECTP